MSPVPQEGERREAPARHNRYVEPWDCPGCNPDGLPPDEWRRRWHARNRPSLLDDADHTGVREAFTQRDGRRELEALRVLSEAATPGEWEAHSTGEIFGADPDDWVAEVPHWDDRVFIAAAVNYVRSLLARAGSGKGGKPSDG